MTQAPAPAQPPRLRRRPGILGAVPLGRMVLVEAVLIAIAAVLPHGPLVAGITAFAGVLVIVVALLRTRGRWWLERRAMAREHGRRRKAGPDLPAADGLPLAMLRTLAPGLTVRDAAGDTPDGPPAGIGCDAAGWFAAIQLGGEGSMSGEGSAGVPLDLLARVLHSADHAGAVVQLCTVSVPAPWQQIDNAQFAARSYHELQQLGQGAPPVPADRVTWVAVRLDARTRAEAGLGGADDAERAPALVASLARKAGRVLRAAGLEHRLLSAPELVAALARACEVDSATPPAGDAWRPREEWTAWRSGELSHNGLWLKTWPRLPDTTALLERLLAMPSTSSAASLTLTREGDGLAARCVLRVAATASALEPSVRAIEEAAAAANAELVRLDGEHGPAVYACAPTGGGAK
ncbi:type VII secretion protein EccE [Dactylosporangium sp. CA-139066]|uniref:type VII secretion protein EccE n=1 Tax=Dactylosporangium sp. CA-139066 TaxID=3239930 RepID=UPI003D905F85